MRIDEHEPKTDSISETPSDQSTVPVVTKKLIESNALTDAQDEQTNRHEYVNQQGVRFTPQTEDEISLVPYSLLSVRELFWFLINLCNPADKQNTDVMIHLGLTLLTVAFEVGADSIGKYSSLLALVKDELCRNLFSVSTFS